MTEALVNASRTAASWDTGLRCLEVTVSLSKTADSHPGVEVEQAPCPTLAYMLDTSVSKRYLALFTKNKGIADPNCDPCAGNSAESTWVRLASFGGVFEGCLRFS